VIVRVPFTLQRTQLLVVEPDYLPDLEVFYFQSCLYPMKYLHPRSMYTLPCGGVQRGGTPSAGSEGLSPGWGSGGKRAPSGGSGAVDALVYVDRLISVEDCCLISVGAENVS
jgi:hypothetical protein